MILIKIIYRLHTGKHTSFFHSFKVFWHSGTQAWDSGTSRLVRLSVSTACFYLASWAVFLCQESRWPEPIDIKSSQSNKLCRRRVLLFPKVHILISQKDPDWPCFVMCSSSDPSQLPEGRGKDVPRTESVRTGSVPRRREIRKLTMQKTNKQSKPVVVTTLHNT